MMMFGNLSVDPKNVSAVFADCDAKRARVVLIEPPQTDVVCDLTSAQALQKYLLSLEPQPKKT